MKRFVVGVMVFCLVCAVHGAELGRQAVESSMVTRDYTVEESDWLSESVGLDLGFDFGMFDWDVGVNSGDDRTFVPQLGVFYGVSDTMDIRATFRWFSVEQQLLVGDSSGLADIGLDIARIGAGCRWYFRQPNGFFPYAGTALNFYILEGDQVGSIDGAVGLSGEAGIAYVVDDFVVIRAGCQLELTVLDGETTLGGHDQDVSIGGFGLGLGVVFAL